MTNEIESTVIAGTHVNSSVATVKKPFAGYKIDDSAFLDSITERTICELCKHSRKYFCYKCYVIMPPLQGKIPHDLKLPMKIDIIKHYAEIDGKSTATHGPILAPDCVNIYIYPDLPDTSNSVLVFPAKDAKEAEVFFAEQKQTHNETFPFQKIIFIDSTWNQTKKIMRDSKLQGLPTIKLSGIESLFWRYQRGNPTTYLATIEAVYHICVAYHRIFISTNYNGEYDNLLFFFRYMFGKVREIYGPDKMRAYSDRPTLQEPTS